MVISQYLSDGIESLVQCHGIGGLRPNTVLLGWPNEWRKAETFGANVRLISRLGRSIIAVRFLEYREDEPEVKADDDAWDVPTGTIDVWWRGKKNGGLMLLLAHLLHQNPVWRRSRIRVLRVVASAEVQAEVTRHIEELCVAARIAADPVVVVSSDPAVAIRETSREAAVILLGFDPPQEGEEEVFFLRMEAFAGDLPRVLLVDSAGGMELES